jgi:hypothetical protein
VPTPLDLSAIALEVKTAQDSAHQVEPGRFGASVCPVTVSRSSAKAPLPTGLLTRVFRQGGYRDDGYIVPGERRTVSC